MKCGLPEQYLKTRRLKKEEIDEMKKLRIGGMSYCKIAYLFGTTRNLARYHCDEYAKYQTKKASRNSAILNKDRILKRGKEFKDRYKNIVGVCQTTILNRANKRLKGIIVKPYKKVF